MKEVHVESMRMVVLGIFGGLVEVLWLEGLERRKGLSGMGLVGESLAGYSGVWKSGWLLWRCLWRFNFGCLCHGEKRWRSMVMVYRCWRFGWHRRRAATKLGKGLTTWQGVDEGCCCGWTWWWVHVGAWRNDGEV